MRKFLTLVPAVALVFAACAEPGQDPSGPQFNKNKNVDTGKICPDGDSGKINTEGDPQEITIYADPGYVLTAVCIKAGQDMVIEVIDRETEYTFTAPNGKAVSHYSFWQVLDDVGDVPPWCSPGFWRNNADKHEASQWPVPTSTKYNDVIPLVTPGPSVLGNPTLLTVLGAPQTYGGTAFNAAATYLSFIKFGVMPEFDDEGKPIHNCELSH